MDAGRSRPDEGNRGLTAGRALTYKKKGLGSVQDLFVLNQQNIKGVNVGGFASNMKPPT